MTPKEYVNPIVNGADAVSEATMLPASRGSLTPAMLAYLDQAGDHLHHFALGREFATSVSRMDVMQTWADLETAGLLHLPYPAISISFYRNDLLLNPLWFSGQSGIDDGQHDTVITFVAYDALGTFKDGGKLPGMSAQLGDEFILRTIGGNEIIAVESLDKLVWLDGSPVHTEAPSNKAFIRMIAVECVNAVGCIVTGLAARNTLRTTSINTRIGTGKRIKTKFQGPQGAVYLSSTLLNMPAPHQLESNPDHPAKEGTSPRPHLRRGHAHTFAVGAGRTGRRKQWVAPMFVNADPSFIAQAREYILK